ncbi:hypothetical protein AB0L00_28070 [Actinoallomurus sp. NPDC052308]|uniref:hypothetical protein n=1 Tax=Actinoallomurus sp. NPDC052308 TaxID=3155530 RepID=UPI00343A8A01
MSADLTAVVVAALGVAGTLVSPLLAQRAALKARQVEAAIQRADRAEDLNEERRRELISQRRQTYADLNARARHYRSAALEHLAALLGVRGTADRTRLELDGARNAFAECFSQAQMIVPDEILELSAEVSRKLGWGYRMLARAAEESDLDEASDYIENVVISAIFAMRAAMREDLGIVEGSSAEGASREASGD